jgi:hypothetical protein
MGVGRFVNEAADQALSNAMYRHTFGIIGNGKFGGEGRGIGTGIGVRWDGAFLILTAAHTMQATPDERLFFLLPAESVVHEGSSVSSETPQATLNTRAQLQRQETRMDDNRDLAAFVLPEQAEERTRRHFYVLNRSHTCPQFANQVGVLGYPGTVSLPVGPNFVANPYSTFGEIVGVPEGCNPDCEIAVSYPVLSSVDPHGLSGAGMWLPQSSAGPLWTPEISLVGLVTRFDPERQVLLGLRVEEIIRFLDAYVTSVAGR